MQILGMKTALAACALALPLAVSVPLTGAAQAQNYAPALVKKSVTLADLSVIAQSLGHTIVETVAEEQTVIVRDSDGLVYYLIGTACDVGKVSGCQGILMQVRYELPPGVTLENLAAANIGNAAVSVWADFEAKTLGVTRYQVLDDGVTMANVAANIGVLLSIAPGAASMATGEN